jgi:WD40 repeat protein
VGTIDQAGGEIRIWDMQTGQARHTQKLAGLAWNPSSFHARWTMQTADLHVSPTLIASADLRIHPGGDRLAVLSLGVLQLWELKAQRELRAVPKPGHFRGVACVAQHAGTRRIASGDADGTIQLWDRSDGRPLQTLSGHAGAVTALAFNAQGGRLASAATDGTIRSWQADGQPVSTFREPKRGTFFRCLTFHPKTGVLAAGTSDGRVVFLDTDRQQVLSTCHIEGSAVRTLAYSETGDLVAAGAPDGRVLIWRTETRALERTLTPNSPVTSLLFADGRDIVITGGQKIQLWESTTARPSLTLEIPGAPVQALTLNRAGSQLTIASSGGMVRVLDVAALHRELTELGLELPGFPFNKP